MPNEFSDFDTAEFRAQAQQHVMAMIALQKTCEHTDWLFEKHGRCCLKCGTFMVDFGD